MTGRTGSFPAPCGARTGWPGHCAAGGDAAGDRGRAGEPAPCRLDRGRGCATGSAAAYGRGMARYHIRQIAFDGNDERRLFEAKTLLGIHGAQRRQRAGADGRKADDHDGFGIVKGGR